LDWKPGQRRAERQRGALSTAGEQRSLPAGPQERREGGLSLRPRGILAQRGEDGIRVIVMAGGRGSRLGFVEKPALRVCGRPLIEAALAAASELGEPLLCTSGSTPLTEELYCGRVRCLRGSGDYVSDLALSLEAAGTPALVLPADMPFIDRAVPELRAFVGLATRSRAEVVTLNACRGGRCWQTGISLFRAPAGEWEDIFISWRPALLDVDTAEDLEEATALCGTMGEGGRGTGRTSA